MVQSGRSHEEDGPHAYYTRVWQKVDKLSLDYLVGLCTKAGVSVGVKVAA
jgi:hypothetical protein